VAGIALALMIKCTLMHSFKKLSCIVCLLFSLPGLEVHASHIVGGEMTYKFKGDTVVSSVTLHKYEVSLALFVDCTNGVDEAITQDNPVFFGVYEGSGNVVRLDTNIYAFSDELLPTTGMSSCGPILNLPNVCLRKRVFLKTYYLPANATGYTVVYQRCCRNANILNVQNPDETGSTYACAIPAAMVTNSSAVFKNAPPQIICINQPFRFDNSAVDPDGDSLSYTFCNALLGASDADIKPIPKAPPYAPVNYAASYSFDNPVDANPAMSINPITGLITGTPTQTGRYLIAVCCNEWRSGALINSVIGEYQIVISDCRIGEMASYKPFAGDDKSILVGGKVHFNAYGGNNYEWTPSTYLSNTHISDPVGSFPTVGVYTYVLTTVTDSGCVGRDTVTIHVWEHSEFVVPNAFSPNGDNLNDLLRPIPVVGARLELFRVFNRKGQMVYDAGATAKGWDGTFHGVVQDVGTYYWELYYYDDKNVLRLTKGDVALVQ
jgi:gliding motility-associated-like protein